MNARGFTLLELLVAITVLSLVSLISWRGLDSLLATRQRLDPEAEEIRALLIAFGQLELDAAQTVSPTFVPGVTPISVRTEGGQVVLEFARFAPAAADKASAIQFVNYQVRDGRWIRESTAPLRSRSPLADDRFSETPLLAGVRSMQVRVWRSGQGWVDAAAGLALPPDAPSGARPPGIEVTIERDDGKRLRRVVVTG